MLPDPATCTHETHGICPQNVHHLPTKCSFTVYLTITGKHEETLQYMRIYEPCPAVTSPEWEPPGLPMRFDDVNSVVQVMVVERHDRLIE